MDTLFRVGLATLCLSLSGSLGREVSGEVVVSPGERGVLIDKVFYDFKFFNYPNPSDAWLDALFVEDGFNGIRTPIFGDSKRPAHPEAGVVVESYYENHINAILRARERAPGLTVFASKKLAGKESFPDWVKGTDGVVAAEYAVLLSDYLEYMLSRGIEVDVLGIDNERDFNEGNITPEVHRDIVDELRALAVAKGYTMPLIIGHEDYGPNKNNWMGVFMGNGWGDRLDIYGTHYYPQFRPIARLKSDLALAGDREKWHTELHWDAKAEQDDFAKAEEAICALWDCTDNGMNGLMWWDYRRAGLRGSMMKHFTVPLIGSIPLAVDDQDGSGIGAYGKLQTRAFLKGDELTVFALNLHDTNVYPDLEFRVDRGRIEGEVTARQWVEGGLAEGEESGVALDSSSRFRYDLPPRSISKFSMRFSENYQLVPASVKGEMNGDELVVSYGREVVESTEPVWVESSWSKSLDTPNWSRDGMTETLVEDAGDRQLIELRLPVEERGFVRIEESRE